MTPKLGPRLQAIADFVLPGAAMADLCCDHGKLAAALVLDGRVPRAIAADVNAAPLAAAAARVDGFGIGDRIALRQGDGAAVLEAGEVETVVIAGIGALLAARIVSEGEASGCLHGVRRLIVQANHGFPKLGSLRASLDVLGWTIVDEAVVAEQGRLYPILVCERGPRRLRDAADRELGPILRERRVRLANAWFARERARVERAIAGMQAGAADAETLAHYRRFLALLD